MKPLLSYSQNKFQALTAPAQIKALNKLLNSLDASLDDHDRSSVLLTQIQKCITWMDKPLAANVLSLTEALHKATSPYQLALAIADFQNSLGWNVKDSGFPVIRGDGMRSTDPAALSRSASVIVILDNLRSAFNVGSIFRSSECLGLQAIWLCGVTATPDNPALLKTARNTTELVGWRYFPDTISAVEAAKAECYSVCALETTQDARSVFAVDFALPLALVVGNESLGIAEEVLSRCDHHVALPVQGWKNSLNVGVAFAVCAYQIVFGPNSPSTPRSANAGK